MKKSKLQEVQRQIEIARGVVRTIPAVITESRLTKESTNTNFGFRFDTVKTQVTIEWPYGYCERLFGTVEEAVTKIIESSDGGTTRQDPCEHGAGYKISEWRLGPSGYEWMHLGTILCEMQNDDGSFSVVRGFVNRHPIALGIIDPSQTKLKLSPHSKNE